MFNMDVGQLTTQFNQTKNIQHSFLAGYIYFLVEKLADFFLLQLIFGLYYFK